MSSSITRTEHGTYRLRWRNAQNQSRSRNYPTLKVATAAQKQLEAELHIGTYIDPQRGHTLLGQWIADWHNSRVNLRPSTYARDDSYIRNLIIPHLGGMQLRHIEPAHIRQWVAGLTATHQPRTIHKAHQLAKAALQAAVEDRYIASNPAMGTKLPRVTDPERRFLTMVEVHLLADAIDPRYRALVYTGALAGLRPGELAGLHISDVDFLRHTITVRRTASETAGRLTYDEPKTPAARRTITISKTLTSILSEHIATYGTADPFLFSTAGGHPIRWTNLRRRQWQAAVNASIGQPCTPHDLRRSHGALCIAEGIHPKMLQARLGHASISTTMNIYGGLFAGYDEAVADALDTTFESARVSVSRQVSDPDAIAVNR